MKKFRLAVLAAVVCTAALLTSCIKEESYEVSTAYLDVSFTTRAGESQVQGDKIEDVMVWAFKSMGVDANGMPTGIADDAKAAGWRKQTGLNTYQSVNMHVELPMCGDGGQHYAMVAIVNNGKFGTITTSSRNPLGGNTTWSELLSAAFDASNQDYWATHIGNVKGDAPDAMPVWHLTTFEVNKGNTHTAIPNTNDYNCAKVTMPVYRAVAKASLSMVKASNFDLTVTDAKLVSDEMPTNGLVLSSLSSENLEDADDLNDIHPTPTWFDSASPTYASSAQERYLMRATDDAQISGANTVSVTAVKPAEGTTTYGFVGSAVIYETDKVCTQSGTTFAEDTVLGDGYYLSVTYKIGEGDEITKHVAIPYAVVRNHDYQIKATVQADGQISVSYTVADWLDKTWNLAFDAPINTNIMTAPSDNADAPGGAPTMRYTNGTEEGAFVGYFKMTGPEGLTWQPTLTKGVRFSIAVYEVINANGTPSLAAEKSQTPIAADAKKWYAIKVIPLEPMDITNPANNKVSLGITYAPKWDEGATDYLFINKGSSVNSSYWPGTYVDESSTFLHKITQNDQTN